MKVLHQSNGKRYLKFTAKERLVGSAHFTMNILLMVASFMTLPAGFSDESKVYGVKILIMNAFVAVYSVIIYSNELPFTSFYIEIGRLNCLIFATLYFADTPTQMMNLFIMAMISALMYITNLLFNIRYQLNFSILDEWRE
ncbi:hypothetical protein WR25_17765 [Diploscapter pachys]|uniref:Uncharacterized protein n=1 Tax=Diploscapter pachys TaxID=2018661 RepID=A0A2A2LQ23_9BILA|nr:hypothetical protein WR25_17765 [Diploscapter pachys]